MISTGDPAMETIMTVGAYALMALMYGLVIVAIVRRIRHKKAFRLPPLLQTLNQAYPQPDHVDPPPGVPRRRERRRRRR